MLPKYNISLITFRGTVSIFLCTKLQQCDNIVSRVHAAILRVPFRQWNLSVCPVSPRHNLSSPSLQQLQLSHDRTAASRLKAHILSLSIFYVAVSQLTGHITHPILSSLLCMTTLSERWRLWPGISRPQWRLRQWWPSNASTYICSAAVLE